MKKSCFLCIVLTLSMLFSCGGNKNYRSSSLYETSEAESQKKEVKEAEKKPLMFYQRLLEQFCQSYYNICFSGREYHYNSLITDNMDVIDGNWDRSGSTPVIVSWNMWIRGRHSFEGRFKNHNDSPFEAFVHDIGNNSYKITFVIKRYDIFGDQMSEEESATRTMTYTE